MRPRSALPHRRQRFGPLGPLVWYARQFARDLSQARTFGLAAELAFWLFFSLLPLALVAGMLGAKLAIGNAPWLDQVLTSVPVQTRTLLHDQLREVAAWNGGSVGLKAALVFVWMASSGVHALFELLELNAGARRSWWKRRLLAIATCVALSVGLALLAVLAAGIDWVQALLRGVLPHLRPAVHGQPWGKVFRLVAGAGTYVALAAGVYRIGVPRRRHHDLPVLPGALLAVGTHLGLGAIYIAYLAEMGIGGAYQAGLAVIAVTLMALYIFSVALLMGAQLNHTLSTDPSTDEPPSEVVCDPRVVRR